MTASGLNENAFAATHKVAKSNLRKMRLKEANTRIGTVEELANALRLRACDLLDPDLARRVDEGEPLRMGEPQPPAMTDAQWRALSPRTRAFIEDLCHLAYAGALTDADIAWLHDSMGRASAAHQQMPAAPQLPALAVETTTFAGKPPVPTKDKPRTAKP